MSTPVPPLVPLPDDDGTHGVPTQEVDGETTVDPDADDAQVNSADADRVAADGAQADESDSL